METYDIRYMTEQHFITAIVAWWVLVMLKAYVHHYEIVIQKNENLHKGGTKVMWWIINAMAFFTHALSFPMEYTTDPQLFGKVSVILFFQVMWHFVIFSPYLNFLRKLGFTYLGKQSMGFDKHFENKPKAYIIFYIACCVLAVISIWLLNIIFRP